MLWAPKPNANPQQNLLASALVYLHFFVMRRFHLPVCMCFDPEYLQVSYAICANSASLAFSSSLSRLYSSLNPAMFSLVARRKKSVR